MLQSPLRSTKRPECELQLYKISCRSKLTHIFVSSNMEQLTEDDLEEFRSEDKATLQAIASAVIIPPIIYAPALNKRTFDIAPSPGRLPDYSQLIAVRRAHETARAKTAVRCTPESGEAAPGASSTTPTARMKLVAKMHSVIREAEANTGLGIGTAVERRLRVSGGSGVPAGTGNAQNAALAAGQRAATVVTRRFKIFKERRVPQYQYLSDAMVGDTKTASGHALLSTGQYGLVLHGSRLLVGRSEYFALTRATNGLNFVSSSNCYIL